MTLKCLATKYRTICPICPLLRETTLQRTDRLDRSEQKTMHRKALQSVRAIFPLSVRAMTVWGSPTSCDGKAAVAFADPFCKAAATSPAVPREKCTASQRAAE